MGKNSNGRKYVIMEGSRELGIVSAMTARSLHRKMVELLASECMKRSRIRAIRCI